MLEILIVFFRNVLLHCSGYCGWQFYFDFKFIIVHPYVLAASIHTNSYKVQKFLDFEFIVVYCYLLVEFIHADTYIRYKSSLILSLLLFIVIYLLNTIHTDTYQYKVQKFLSNIVPLSYSHVFRNTSVLEHFVLNASHGCNNFLTTSMLAVFGTDISKLKLYDSYY